MARFHRPSEDYAAEFAGCRGWDRPFKEDPYMAALSRSRAFQYGWYVEFTADREKCGCIFMPCLLVEVSRQKPTRLIQKEWVDSNRKIAHKMGSHNVISERPVSSRLTVNLLSILLLRI
jgi:hypothetical protein